MMIGLFPSEKIPKAFELAVAIQLFLSSRGITVVAEEPFAKELNITSFSEVDKNEVNFLISLGGDGTMLGLLKRYRSLQIPMLGINLGHLGFMADVPTDDLYPSLEELLEGKYTIQDRLILEAVLPNGDHFYAGNDLVVHRGKNPSLIEVATHAGGRFLTNFLADGLVVATPNGSTAYSLAAGGPILSPVLDGFVVTPISAHTISNRPIVLTADMELQIQYLSQLQPISLCADGIDHAEISSGQIIKINKSSSTFRLVNLHRHDYFTTLRRKLGWSGKLMVNS